jgi:hypothetical protein
MKSSMAILAACAMMLAVPALAQTETYETPGYTPPNTPTYTLAEPTVLDPNYGLPSFGMPDAALPQQRTLATEAAAAALMPDAGRPPIDLTPPKEPAATSLTTETPLYTTSETGTTGSDTMPGAE